MIILPTAKKLPPLSNKVFSGPYYITALVQHQINLILRHHQIPFLHVRADNQRAIAVYERLGFVPQGEMNFYLLRK